MTMTNLEPCPFCGGEAYLTHGEAVYSKLPMFKCKDCGAVTSFDDPIPNAAMMVGDDTPAIEMFNTRYKRTCKWIIGVGENSAFAECSACKAMFFIDIDIATFKHCPNCGAEVADGDS